MAKAILVVDTHKLGECTHCPMHYENQDFKYRCFVDDWIDATKGKCPLKPMPEKIEIPPIPKGILKTVWEKEKHKREGWNMCVEKILGEVK